MYNWLKLLRQAAFLLVSAAVLYYSIGGGFGHYTLTALAESIHLTATVAADPSDFQLVLQRTDGPGPILPNTEVTYALVYGSHLSAQTDIIVLEVGWSRGQINDGSGSLLDIVSYVPGSATNALGGGAPVVDLANRTITWQISPMPSIDNQMLIWKLKTNQAYTGSSQVLFDVTARLIGPGTEKQAAPLNNIYVFQLPPTPTPTPTPTPPPVPTATPTPTPTITTTPEATSSATPTPTASPTPLIPLPTSLPSSPPPPPFNSLQPIINAIEDIPVVGKPIKEVVDKVAEVAQNSGSLAAAPAPFLLTLIPTLSTIGSLLGYAPWWQIPTLLGALFWNRKRHPWGVVYDSITKQPLDPVLLTLTDGQGRSYQTISDIYGRYQFLVEPGRYTLAVKKTNYTFPATSLNSEPTDGLYLDLFYGGPIEVNDASAINYNIPMDPVAADWNQQKKTTMGLTTNLPIPKNVLTWLFWVGFVWSLMMVLLALTAINVVIIILYLSLVLLRFVHRWRQPWGVVFDRTNHPIAAAAVHLIDLRNPQLRRPPVVTKESGRYAFLVDQGDYQVSVAVKKPYGYGAPVKGPKISITSKQGTISHDVVVDQEANASPPDAVPEVPGILLNPNSDYVKSKLSE